MQSTVLILNVPDNRYSLATGTNHVCQVYDHLLGCLAPSVSPRPHMPGRAYLEQNQWEE